MNQAIILAAGESSRFWPLNTKHKTLFKIMGKPLLYYTIEGLSRNGIKDIIVVQGKDREVEKAIGNFFFKGARIRYVTQAEPKGMGDALWCAKGYLEDRFLVLNAERIDAGNHVKAIIGKQKAKLVILGAKTDAPQLYGMLSLEGDKIKGLVEKPEKGKEPSDVKAAGVYLLSKDFFDYYEKTGKGMYSFEEALDQYVKENDARVAMAKEDLLPLKYPWHLFAVEKYLMAGHLGKKISKKARIAKSAVIEGDVFIGDGVKVFENAVIKGPCYIGDNSTIGNNAIIRDHADLEEGALVGANMEVARSIFEENVHVHSGFLGDSIIGKDCKIGAGTITANVRIDRGEISTLVKGEKTATGLKSLGVIIGENSKLGIRCSLMPGVMIGSGCKIGPNSVVSKNIENDTSI
jgi:bifunctional UDP-N-acetylglucosamine pyrophosphorylase/glucosamine-1-phosphate N-acetyltransferase